MAQINITLNQEEILDILSKNRDEKKELTSETDSEIVSSLRE